MHLSYRALLQVYRLDSASLVRYVPAMRVS